MVIDNNLGLDAYLYEVGCSNFARYYDICIYRVDRIPSVETVSTGEEYTSGNVYKDSDKVLDDLLMNDYLTNVNKLYITIPGMQNTYTYCVWNDTHLWATDGDPEVLDEQKENVASRMKSLCINEYDIESRKAFQAVMKDVDSLILNADIIDQMSVANLSFVRENLQRLNTPCMYLRSDHDIARDWTVCDEDTVASIESEMNLNQCIYVMEQDEFIILGVNNSF